MKKIFIMSAALAALWSCSYDDTDLWSKVNEHEERLDEIERTLLEISNEENTYIAGIEETDRGWTITLSDGRELDINHGRDGEKGEKGDDGMDGTGGEDHFVDVDTSDDDVVAFTMPDGTVIYVKRLNYSDPDGAFLLNEGSGHGTIVWFDGNLNEYRDIYQKANGGRNPGEFLQDMFISDGKAYLLCQGKGMDSENGDGQLLVCDAKTMRLIEAYDGLDFGHGMPGTPQHLVVAGDKAFIQYSTDDAASGWEYWGEGASGIRVFDLATGTLKADDIAGTYGTFGYGTTEKPEGGALKARMLYSRGKIIAGLAKGVVFIDPGTETVTKTITFTGGVKDVVKGHDGNLYIAVTGDFTEPLDPTDWLASDPEGSKIYKYSQSGEEISHIALTTAEEDKSAGIFTTSTAAPNIGMCADPNSSYIYFNADTGMMGMGWVARYDYTETDDSEAVTMEFVQPQRGNSVYGYLGVHPTHKHLFVPVNINFEMSRLAVYNIAMASAPEKIFDTFQRYNGYTSSPSGVFFTGQFSDEYFAQ